MNQVPFSGLLWMKKTRCISCHPFSLTQVNECICQLSLVGFPCESKDAKSQISINLNVLKVRNVSKTRYASILSPFTLFCNMFIFYGFTQSAFIFYCSLDNVVGIGYSVVISYICSWRCIYIYIYIYEHRCDPG